MRAVAMNSMEPAAQFFEADGRGPIRIFGDDLQVAAVGELRVGLNNYEVWLEGKRLNISPTQAELLAFLIANQERVVSRGELIRTLGVRPGRSVDVMLTRIRKILAREFVRNVRNRGWILIPEAFD